MEEPHLKQPKQGHTNLLQTNFQCFKFKSLWDVVKEGLQDFELLWWLEMFSTSRHGKLTLRFFVSKVNFPKYAVSGCKKRYK